MKLVVENFGPIKKAEVELGPMTVFVGPSNAGKSYLAVLIYSILSAAHNTAYGHFVGSKYFSDWEETRDSADEEFDGPVEPEDPDEFLLCRIEESFKVWAKRLSVIWMRRMEGCFLDAEMRLWMKEGKRIEVSDDQGQLVLDLLAPYNSKISDSQKRAIFEKIRNIPEVLQVLVDEFFVEVARNMKTGLMRGTFVDCLDPVLASMLLGSASDYPPMPAHYLPAARSSLIQNLRNQVVLTLGSGRHGPGRNLHYPLFISDFLEKLLYWNKGNLYRGAIHVGAFDGTNQQKKNIQKAGSFVEEKIMGGALKAEDVQGVYPEFRYVYGDDNERDCVPLLHASSMVAELASLVVFIREHIYPGDLLIMEEPEAGLHPGAQRNIANALVQLANAGVRVLITTHSNIVLEQLGNYVQAAEVGEKLNAQSLAKEKVGAFLFAQSKGEKNNTKVEKFGFTPETGLLSKDHTAVSSALYNETVSLLEKGDEHAQD